MMNASFLYIVLLFQFLNVNCNQCDQDNSKGCETSTLNNLISAIGRSVTTSSVVTVNLKNAAILAAVKAIVIIAGILGKISFWSFPNLGSGRKLQAFEKRVVEEIKLPFMADEDLRWASTYMWALNKADFGCFYRLACENPHSAVVYSHAAVILRDIASYFGLLKQKKFYGKVIFNVETASFAGIQSKNNCKLYSCHSPFKRI